MKIEIWSDVMCPFCYIGKKHIEQAISTLPFKDKIEIEWKSYQLNPDYHNTANEDLYTYLARSKGMAIAQVRQMTGQVEEMANRVGLKINFAGSIPANSFDAHRLIHFANSKGLQQEAEEALFEAHFIAGKDVADKATLIAIAAQLGLEKAEVQGILESDDFAESVRHDIYESKQIGIQGVPYFVLDRKYALSGAQPIETFAQAITQSFNEWSAERA
ncbi:DSBA-like thioredoxin domain protein [compost metagenome]